jgi:hypothetical protein
MQSRLKFALCVVRAFPGAGSRIYDRFVPPANAADLGIIRLVVFAFLLANTLCRDLPSVAELPPEIRREMGVMQLLHRLPAWDRVYVDHVPLRWLKTATVVATLLAASGTLTRATVPAATLLTLVHDGIFREYSHFFHTGLVPAYCGAVLTIAPCGDAWSIDSLIRKTRVREDRSVMYGWARYAIWIVVAGVYVCAGMSKLSNGGLWWWHGDNLKPMILTTNLNADHLELGNSRFLAAVPNPYFSALGIAGLLVELLYGLVLVSRRARLTLPAAAITLHLGILVCQGIPFFDLIAVQAAFVNWGALTGGMKLSRAAPHSTEPGKEDLDRGRSGSHWRGLALSVVLVSGTAGCWIGHVEWYPLTAWQMYSVYSPGTRAWYVKVIALSEDGTMREICAARYIDAAPTNTDLTALKPDQIRATFAAIKRVANEKRRPGDPAIVSVALETWLWDFGNAPDSPTFGLLIHRILDSAAADAGQGRQFPF